MKQTLFILSLFLLFGVVACSDGETTVDSEESLIEEDDSLILDTLQYRMLLCELCYVEDLSNGTTSYTPRHGYALYSATPTIYYVGVDSLPQAQDKWQDITAGLRDSTEERTLTNEVNVLDLHLTYSEGREGELARIDVDCPELQNVLTSIVFIPMVQWPNNDTSSPILLCSVWKENSTGYYYLCVRKANADKGILMTFDGGYKMDHFTDPDRVPRYNGPFFLWEDCARTDDFRQLVFCMKEKQKLFLKAQQKIIDDAGSYENLSENRRYTLNNGSLEDNRFRFHNGTFDHEYTWRGDSKWNWHKLEKEKKFYRINVHRTRIEWTNLERKDWVDHYGDAQRPPVYYPSHAIYFDYHFKPTGFTCIFKGVDS